MLFGSKAEPRVKNPFIAFNGSNFYHLGLFETTSVYNIHGEIFAGSLDRPNRRNRRQDHPNG
jgi:hypothetical protein